MTYQPRRPARHAAAAVSALLRVGGAVALGVTLAIVYVVVLVLA